MKIVQHVKIAAGLGAAAVLLTGCGANAGHEAARPSGGTASAKVSQPASPSHASVQLIWHHAVQDSGSGEVQVWYVARVTNPGGSPASVALDARVLDSSGTIVGSSQETLPNIPARSHFDYFGCLGGGGGACAFNSKLTGTPSKVEVTEASNSFGQAGGIELPMLKTSEITLRAGSEDTFTNAAYSYNLSAKVTNTTGQVVTGGVTQQVVLYDQAGQVAGGGSASSDNVPHTLPAGMSYRESWTGIPAVHPVVRAAYTVWPAS